MYFSFGYFWSLTFSGEDQEEWRTSNTYEHESYTLDLPWWRNNYERRLELHTLEVLQTPSVGEVCEYPKVSYFLNSYLVLELVYVLASCSIKKWEELPWWQQWVFINKNVVVSTLNVLLLTLNKALPGGRPRITRFVFVLIPCLNNVQSCFVLPLSVLICSSLNVCHETHS